MDDATPGRERLTRFGGLLEVIRADRPGEVPDALAAIERARTAGWHAAGYLSYELGYLLEPRLAPLLPERRAVPLLWFGVFERAENDGLEEHGRAYAGPLRHEWDAQRYHRRFRHMRRYIEDGDVEQANLSFRSHFAFAGDAMALYRRLRARSNAAHGAFIDDGERQILSLSPEPFFDLTADGRLAAEPTKGMIARGADVTSILRALFPCGSITGTPKIRAMEVIRELEESPRGLYCGAIGWFSPGGAARFGTAIRTLTISGGQGELGIGSAVARDSTAGSGFDACLLEARWYRAARRPLELIETLRWSRAEGFVRLERHLGRLARSAEFFGLPCERERLVLPSGADEDLCVRIALNEAGEFHCTAVPLGKVQARWTYAISPLRVRSCDLLARHKISWRDQYETVPGCDETIFLNEKGEVAEGSRSTVFLRRGGELLTPPLPAGILDGCLRRELMETGRCREAMLRPRDLETGEVLFGNSLRGLIPAVAAFETV